MYFLELANFFFKAVNASSVTVGDFRAISNDSKETLPPEVPDIAFKTFKNVIFYNKISSACKNSDLIILHTEWNEFRNLNFKKLVGHNRFSVYDMRNIYSQKKMSNNGIKYFKI